MLDIFAVQAFVDRAASAGFGATPDQIDEDVALQYVFLLVGQLESGMIDDLDAVVLIRIVRSRNHDAGGERPGSRRRARCRVW